VAIHNDLKNIKAIILDMDGVLVDTEPIHMKAFEIFLKKYNIVTNRDYLMRMIGHSVENNFTVLLADYPALKQNSLPAMIKERNNLYLELLRQTPLKPISGIPDLIDFCMNNNIKLALASSSDQPQVDTVLESLTINAENDLNISGVFHAIVSGDSVRHKKPQPDIYFKALQKLGIDAKEAIAIEDSQAGISSAAAAGIKCLALKNPYFDLRKMSGFYLALETVHDLVEILFEEFD
jgi:beta-phosphoglucomutase-like phosphatase (HAD superfamily)